MWLNIHIPLLSTHSKDVKLFYWLVACTLMVIVQLFPIAKSQSASINKMEHIYVHACAQILFILKNKREEYIFLKNLQKA